jgi:hypothetical protein
LTLATSFAHTYGRIRQPGRPTIYSRTYSSVSRRISLPLTGIFARPVISISGITSRHATFSTQRGSKQACLHSYLTLTSQGVILSREPGNRAYSRAANALAHPNTRHKKPEHTADQTTPISAKHGLDILKPTTSNLKATSEQLLKATSRIARSIKDDYPHQQFELGDESEDERTIALKSQLDMADQAKIIDGMAISK